MRGWSRLFLLANIGVVLIANWEVLPPVTACPACVGTTGPQLSFVQQVVNCDVALCARQTPDRRRFAIQFCFKGQLPQDGEIVLPAAELPQGRIPKESEVVLGHESLSQQWKFLGTISPGHREWLQAIGPMKRTADLSESDWIERSRFFLGSLDRDEPLIRETVFRELSRTPYAIMRACRQDLDAGLLLRSLKPDRFPERRALVALLLGISGGPVADQWLAEARVEESRRREGTTRAALLVARLEREGAVALPDFLREEIVAASLREGERRSALLALSVQGTADGAIPRQDVVALYERVLEERPELADQVATDAAAWNEKSLVPPLRRILNAGVVSEGARESIGRSLESIVGREEYRTDRDPRDE